MASHSLTQSIPARIPFEREIDVGRLNDDDLSAGWEHTAVLDAAQGAGAQARAVGDNIDTREHDVANVLDQTAVDRAAQGSEGAEEVGEKIEYKKETTRARRNDVLVCILVCIDDPDASLSRIALAVVPKLPVCHNIQLFRGDDSDQYIGMNVRSNHKMSDRKRFGSYTPLSDVVLVGVASPVRAGPANHQKVIATICRRVPGRGVVFVKLAREVARDDRDLEAPLLQYQSGGQANHAGSDDDGLLSHGWYVRRRGSWRRGLSSRGLRSGRGFTYTKHYENGLTTPIALAEIDIFVHMVTGKFGPTNQIMKRRADPSEYCKGFCIYCIPKGKPELIGGSARPKTRRLLSQQRIYVIRVLAAFLHSFYTRTKSDMVKKHKLTPDDLECSEGGIHGTSPLQFQALSHDSRHLQNDLVLPLHPHFRALLRLFLVRCGTYPSLFTVLLYSASIKVGLFRKVRHSTHQPPPLPTPQRDPERDGFGGWGKAHGKRPCVKCAMTYQEAKSQLSVMTDDEKQRVWNETYGEQTVYLTRAQEHQQQHLEVVASHHDAQQLNDAYAQTHDGHQRRQSASGPTPPYPRTQMQQDPQYSRSPPGHLAPPSYNP
ncbi:hypothetical protein BC938DRAFT_477154 [Jimgerdemannia flammicorona]|uniref:Uncharacterized protein n=1 Tax=Jimgerdemannia flammicorona TaxID=994334 RepID=A0A433QZ09_9FUNG|nr:hypothetical protein BC938DRAFT_477154 [Jimgerdemannia flammicorona]